MYMKFEMDKILQLEYLEQCILKLDNEIDNIANDSSIHYDFDSIMLLDVSQLVELFSRYNISYSAIIKYKESNLVDNSEYSDLFPLSNSISVNNNEILKNNVLDCIEKLNEKISSELKVKIDELEQVKNFIKGIISFLTIDHIATKEDIENLVKLIENSDLTDDEKVQFSFLISKYLIDRNKSLTVPKTLIVGVSSDFETELSKIYDESEQIETTYLNDSEYKYADIINEYYKKYQEMFIDAGFNGMELEEILAFAHGVANEIIINENSVSKIDFVLKIANLLFVLKNTTDEIEVADTLEELKKCDRMVETSKLSEELVVSVNQTLEALIDLSTIPADENNRVSLISELNLLVKKLTDNILSSEEIKEIANKYTELKKFVDKIIDNKNIFNTLTQMQKTVEDLINYASANNIQDYFNKLVVKQAKIIEIIQVVNTQGLNDLTINEVINSLTSSIQEIYENIHGTKKKDNTKMEKVELESFVLFDVDDKGQSYVISRDLNRKYPKNFVDDSLTQEEITSGFHDYVKLIYDLHVLGQPEIVFTNTPHMSKIMDHVFLDPENRKSKTPMKRIRPLPRSFSRFVDEKIILYPGTPMYEQVSTIFKEMFPWITFSNNGQLVLYINFASGIKRVEEDLYDVAIARYKNRISVYKKLSESGNTNVKLTDEECNLLRELIKISVNVCDELSKLHPEVKFEFFTGKGGINHGL